ncbi:MULTISPECIES: PIG-L family deacetylase [Lysinibacillus]|uniref:PIG-L family deacetylase n=1 Tax=Lysinibacillus antri TaxID=2498145 RepID=A0A432LF62_9BACI|nr:MULTISPECIES: PIG-L family deacetylase [Lysinibacillus]RUL54792.1 hypothetical protein EK386_06390 [Lysinibacillus antri]TSI10925.1 hypothetical protein FJQ64_01770 [Lysinibacillus sp. BW-2-10]
MQQFNAIVFVIVAHMDDWLLFMNPNIRYELANKNNKVVFIYTTANDAGASETFWRGNEEASLSSIRFGVTYENEEKEYRDQVKLNNHLLHRWTYGNVVSYFLRLPDGNLSGNGFSSQGYQSLQKLYLREIPDICTLDHSTVYHGWDDLVNTIQSIIDFEGDNHSVIKINFPEPDRVINQGDHSDHITTGLAVRVIPKYNNYYSYSYKGYSISNYPIDLTGEDLFWKIGMFFVYDKTLYDLTGYSLLQRNPNTFMEFCFRSSKFQVEGCLNDTKLENTIRFNHNTRKK